MNMVIDVDAILLLHDQSIIHWRETGVQVVQEGFLKIVQENHAFNYQLWSAEDRARRDDFGYEFVYMAKREIDQYNQCRNDRMEMMDQYILEVLCPALPESCPVHSETPGMIVDRLSILSLKIYHMALQAERQTADEAHRLICKEKLAVLMRQRTYLGGCLKEFFTQILNQTRTFFTYHQFKMYNDKHLNPELYKH